MYKRRGLEGIRDKLQAQLHVPVFITAATVMLTHLSYACHVNPHIPACPQSPPPHIFVKYTRNNSALYVCFFFQNTKYSPSTF